MDQTQEARQSILTAQPTRLMKATNERGKLGGSGRKEDLIIIFVFDCLRFTFLQPIFLDATLNVAFSRYRILAN